MAQSNKSKIDAVRNSLSPARMGTYDQAANIKDDEDLSALLLYAWNAKVSSALLHPLHICEVVIRNAVSDALEAKYGVRWPWSRAFLQSLPNPPPRVGYNPQRDLQNTTRRAQTTGKVIPELKFVFWQKMFTARHDDRIWNKHLNRVFQNLNRAQKPATHRQRIYKDLDRIRALRNRIAHHEPIFKRDLISDYSVIHKLINSRCQITGTWLDENQIAKDVIENKP